MVIDRTNTLARLLAHPASLFALLLLVALLPAASSAQPASGEGYLLSKNADFSTDDRSFDPTDMLHMLLWSEEVDHGNMNKLEWELKDASKNKLKQGLTNHGDGSFSATFSLADLPSNAAEWTWKGKLQDKNKAKYQSQADLTVGVAGAAGVAGETGGGQSPCTAGECFVLSKNADFSTDDRSFTLNDTLHMYVFSDQVDSTDIQKSEWDLKDAEKASVKQGFAQHGDGSFTAAYNLSDLPSELVSWTWKGKLQDNSKAKYQPTATIDVTLGNETVAAFASAPAQAGVAPMPVDFEDRSTEEPTSWDWDFGDGETSTEQNPSHVFETEGTYSVTLRASNAMGSDTMVMANYISVPEPGSAIQLISGILGLFALNLRRHRH